jgi:hypothetical protein
VHAGGVLTRVTSPTQCSEFSTLQNERIEPASSRGSAWRCPSGVIADDCP